VYTSGTTLPGVNTTSDKSLDSILLQLSQITNTLKTSLDVSALDNECFSFNPASDQLKVLFQETISKICSIETEIGSLQDGLNSIPDLVSTTTITGLDLKCLATNPCGGPYTLTQVLQLMINKICE
jgi:hypothetical protein